MNKFKDLKLSTKFMLSIGAILVCLTAFDVWFSVRREKALVYNEIRSWTFIFAENVRTTLNTLMKEGKMDIRFAMLDEMSKEIKGLKNVRIIRGPKVNEIFAKIKEEELVPKEREAIARYRDKIAKLEQELADTRDKDEISDLKDEVESLKGSIEKAQENIDGAKVMKTDPREIAIDDLDREVLSKGSPVYHFEGDNARVLVPYISKKSCSTASGCHKYAKEGDVLGAINMEFSIEDVRKEILYNNLKTAGFGLIRLAIVLGVLALFLSIFIIRNINHILEGLKRISTGDFTGRLSVASNDEMGGLARGFNFFIDRFNDIIKELKEATVKISSTSEELSTYSSQIVKGAESQQARTAQVASSSEELSLTINEVAKNSIDAAHTAKDTDAEAQKGREIVGAAVSGLNGIVPKVKESAGLVSRLGTSSHEIGKIIMVINDIADQTNLLALNAAIEAARAGEQGRGFAVVADEVKKLAERTSRSTKEIESMVKGIQDDTRKAISSMDEEVTAVGEAVEMARKADGALNEIVNNVEKVASMIRQIATSSEEQSTAAGQISEDIEAVSKVTNETAGEVKHIAEAANDLATLSVKLKDMISHFKVDEDDGQNEQEPGADTRAAHYYKRASNA